MENIRLDLKDKKILFELDMNARQSYAEIAKKVKMSKQGVEYKINNLIKKKVILGFYPIVDMTKMGYKYCRLVIKLQNVSSNKEKEIIDFINKHTKIGWVINIEGPYDIGMGIWAKSITEFKEVINEFVYKFGDNILKRVESIGINVYHYSTRYLLNKTETNEINLKETSNVLTIDSIESKILRILCDNARTSLVEISDKLDISAKIISYRIKKLEKEGILRGYRVILNHFLLGYTYYKIVLDLSNVTKESYKQIKEYLKYQSQVLYIVEAVGWKDLDFEIIMESNNKFFEFMKKLRQNFPILIKDYEVLIFTDTIKVKYIPD